MITRYAAMNLLWCVPGVGGSEEYLLRQLDGLSSIKHNQPMIYLLLLKNRNMHMNLRHI